MSNEARKWTEASAQVGRAKWPKINNTSRGAGRPVAGNPLPAGPGKSGKANKLLVGPVVVSLARARARFRRREGAATRMRTAPSVCPPVRSFARSFDAR